MCRVCTTDLTLTTMSYEATVTKKTVLFSFLGDPPSGNVTAQFLSPPATFKGVKGALVLAAGTEAASVPGKR